MIYGHIKPYSYLNIIQQRFRVCLALLLIVLMNCLNKYYQFLKSNSYYNLQFTINNHKWNMHICIYFVILTFIEIHIKKNLNIKYTGAEFGLGHCLALQQITTEIAHLAWAAHAYDLSLEVLFHLSIQHSFFTRR